MKFILSFTLSIFLLMSQTAMAQEEHESFKKEAELKAAFLKMDLTPFMEEPVNFICDTLDRTAKTAGSLNELLKLCVTFPKNTTVRKASETNNGYVQTLGIYKNDDALMYVRFTLNPESGKLEEVLIEKND